jgi:hypothetical protein
MEMAPMDELTRICHEIADTCDRLDEINKALDRCPEHKRGTRWWVDRCQAREELLTIRKRLFAELARLLADRPEAALMKPLPGHPVPECFLS